MSVGIVELFEAGVTTGSRLPFTTIASSLLILILVLLLIEKEFIRIVGNPSAKRWMRLLDVFIIPAMMAVVFIIFALLWALIQ
jgi:hypothetical protein